MAEQPAGSVTDLSFRSVAVRDPLEPVTRQQRLYLLAVSMIGIAIVRTGLVPSKIATFGIELNEPNRDALLFLLALVTIYFLASFVIYAASDFERRREALTAAQEREETRTRYKEVAAALDVSEETLRKQYAQRDTDDFEYYVENRLIGRLGSDRANEAETLAKRAVAYLEERSDEPPPIDAGEEIGYQTSQDMAGIGTEATGLIALTRVVFEFFVPPIVALYAIYALLFRALVIPEIVAWIATFAAIGAIAGTVAKLLFPAPDPLGIRGVALLGIAGSFIGGVAANLLLVGGGAWIINLTSILAATVGTLTLLAMYYWLLRRTV